jgi:hypothetical protein
MIASNLTYKNYFRNEALSSVGSQQT